MNHVDVFTGIGGFAYAAREVWGDDYKNICFCDNNKFCQEVIKKNFGKESLIYSDIREITREVLCRDYYQRLNVGGKVRINGKKNGYRSTTTITTGIEIANVAGNMKSEKDIRGTLEDEKNKKQIIADTGIQEQRRISDVKREENTAIRKSRVDLLTGGFPCQPFSGAGKRRGKADDRYLWPEMLRVIKETGPRWFIGENVAGLIGMAQRQGDIEMEGQTDNENDIDEGGNADGIICEIIDQIEEIGYTVQAFVIPACAVNAPHRRDRVWIVAHTGYGNGQGTQKKRKFKGQISCQKNAIKYKRSNSNDGKGNNPDTICNRSQGMRKKQKRKRSNRLHDREKYGWNKNWFEVAGEFCRVDDGLPVELDGFKLTKAGHRVERLKALGNAIVPQVAIEIMRAIKEIDYEKQMD